MVQTSITALTNKAMAGGVDETILENYHSWCTDTVKMSLGQ